MDKIKMKANPAKPVDGKLPTLDFNPAGKLEKKAQTMVQFEITKSLEAYISSSDYVVTFTWNGTPTKLKVDSVLEFNVGDKGTIDKYELNIDSSSEGGSLRSTTNSGNTTTGEIIVY